MILQVRFAAKNWWLTLELFPRGKAVALQREAGTTGSDSVANRPQREGFPKKKDFSRSNRPVKICGYEALERVALHVLVLENLFIENKRKRSAAFTVCTWTGHCLTY